MTTDLFGNKILDQTRLQKKNGSKYKAAPSIPYMGNKNQIALQIVNQLPDCNVFLDGCFGGGVIGYTMQSTGKCNTLIANDIDKSMIDLHVALNNDEIDFSAPKFCTRTEFFQSVERVKQGEYTALDVLNTVVYSFGNDRRSYLFSPQNEAVKGLAHNMITARTKEERRSFYMKFMRSLGSLQSLERLESLQSLGSLQSLQSLERLESLQSLGSLQSLQSLESNRVFMSEDIFKIDYSQIDVAYFDIPYENTAGYMCGDFDHERFWKWFMELKIPAYASSYVARNGVPVKAEFAKAQLMSVKNQKHGAKKQQGLEKLFWNGK